jgi:hypothetical protein
MLKFLSIFVLMLPAPQRATFYGQNTGTSAGACTGQPAWDFQLQSSTVAPGTVTTWTDTIAANVVTVTGSPVAGASDPTPNGTRTVVFSGTGSGTLASPIGGAGAPTVVSVWAVYKINSNTNKNTLTSFGGSSGAPAYFTNGASNAPAGLDESQIANVANATATPTTAWADTGVTYTVGGTITFYRAGSTDGSTTSSVAFTNPIQAVFSNAGGSEPITMTLAELDIKLGNVTGTQATAVHNCMVSLYGAV